MDELARALAIQNLDRVSVGWAFMLTGSYPVPAPGSTLVHCWV